MRAVPAKVKVRILRPDPRSALTLGYAKGRIVEVSPEQAAAWVETKYAELATDDPAPAAPSVAQAPSPAVVTRRRAR